MPALRTQHPAPDTSITEHRGVQTVLPRTCGLASKLSDYHLDAQYVSGTVIPATLCWGGQVSS